MGIVVAVAGSVVVVIVVLDDDVPVIGAVVVSAFVSGMQSAQRVTNGDRDAESEEMMKGEGAECKNAVRCRHWQNATKITADFTDLRARCSMPFVDQHITTMLRALPVCLSFPVSILPHRPVRKFSQILLQIDWMKPQYRFWQDNGHIGLALMMTFPFLYTRNVHISLPFHPTWELLRQN